MHNKQGDSECICAIGFSLFIGIFLYIVSIEPWRANVLAAERNSIETIPCKFLALPRCTKLSSHSSNKYICIVGVKWLGPEMSHVHNIKFCNFYSFPGMKCYLGDICCITNYYNGYGQWSISLERDEVHPNSRSMAVCGTAKTKKCFMPLREVVKSNEMMGTKVTRPRLRRTEITSYPNFCSVCKMCL